MSQHTPNLPTHVATPTSPWQYEHSVTCVATPANGAELGTRMAARSMRHDVRDQGIMRSFTGNADCTYASPADRMTALADIGLSLEDKVHAMNVSIVYGEGAVGVATAILVNMDRAGDGRMLELEEADRIYDSIVGPAAPICRAITYGVENQCGCDQCRARMGFAPQKPETTEHRNARALALLALQSDRYRQDADFRDCVDTVLADTRHVWW